MGVTADPTSFEAFYSANRDRIYRVISVAVPPEADPAEATSEAFVRACVRWRRVRAHPNPVGWVVTTALNYQRSHWRRSRIPVDPRCRTHRHPPSPSSRRSSASYAGFLDGSARSWSYASCATSARRDSLGPGDRARDRDCSRPPIRCDATCGARRPRKGGASWLATSTWPSGCALRSTTASLTSR
jgi:Sigma-70 region 2